MEFYFSRTILGACNPAYKVLLAEDTIETLLPCHVIVQKKANDQKQVSL